jgi:hypothetical protein
MFENKIAWTATTTGVWAKCLSRDGSEVYAGPTVTDRARIGNVILAENGARAIIDALCEAYPALKPAPAALTELERAAMAYGLAIAPVAANGKLFPTQEIRDAWAGLAGAYRAHLAAQAAETEVRLLNRYRRAEDNENDPAALRELAAAATALAEHLAQKETAR